MKNIWLTFVIHTVFTVNLLRQENKKNSFQESSQPTYYTFFPENLSSVLVKKLLETGKKNGKVADTTYLH